MVVAVATLAFSVGINSTANAADINNATELLRINDDIDANLDIGEHYYLQSNIDLSGITFEDPLYTYIKNSFRGIFDGQGHTIYNLAAPLFDVIGGNFYDDATGQYIYQPGEVRNLGLKTGESGIVGDASNGYVGVLAGGLDDESTVDSVGVSGSISTRAGDAAGGLVGFAGDGSTISNSHSLVSINTVAAIDDQGNNVPGIAGGLVGQLNYGTITNSTSTGSVSTSSGYAAMGGLVGLSINGNIENSSASGNVTISGNDKELFQGAAGGLVGAMIYSNVANSSASGDVTTTGNSTNFMGGMGFINGPGGTGGLVGAVDYGSNVYNSSASGDVSSQSSNTGGLVGWVNGGYISGNSAVGDVTVAIGKIFYDVPDPIDPQLPPVELMIESVGGLVGYSSSTISSSYAEGIVHVSTSVESRADIRFVGGLVGEGYGVAQSVAFGDVTAESGSSNVTGIGGLAGVVWTSVWNSAAVGDVTTTGDGSSGIGGLVGISGVGFQQFNGEISNSYASGDVLHTGAESGDIGGLVGTGYGIIDSSATGVVTAIGANSEVNAFAGSYNFIDNEFNVAGVGPTYPPGPTEPPMYEGAQLLNYINESASSDAWDQDPAVIGDRPYIQALLEFGFYTDDFFVKKTPKPTAAAIAYVNSNPKFTQAESTILRLFLYLAGDESIRITIKDFEVLGATGVNEKNLPVLLKLLKKVELSTLDLTVINKNIKIADELLKKKKKK